jgi:esterase/lipase
LLQLETNREVTLSVTIYKILINALKKISLLFIGGICTFALAQEDVPEIEEPTPEEVHQVKFMTQDKFMLTGKYFAGKADHSGVLLLHDCSHDSSSYDKLTELLSNYGIHALSLDLRGYGESISDEFSHRIIKSNSKDISTYQSEFMRITSFWKSDVLAAYNYLRSRIDNKRDVAVVSAGCSSSQAIFLAQKMRIKSFVMITPILNYMEKDHYKNLIDIPAYFLSSTHDAETYQTSKELFDWNGDDRSTFQLFKGNRQGNSLLNRKRYLSHDVALWLNDNLSK